VVARIENPVIIEKNSPSWMNKLHKQKQSRCPNAWYHQKWAFGMTLEKSTISNQDAALGAGGRASGGLRACIIWKWMSKRGTIRSCLAYFCSISQRPERGLVDRHKGEATD
jgi:hypothetical protein